MTKTTQTRPEINENVAQALTGAWSARWALERLRGQPHYEYSGTMLPVLGDSFADDYEIVVYPWWERGGDSPSWHNGSRADPTEKAVACWIFTVGDELRPETARRLWDLNVDCDEAERRWSFLDPDTDLEAEGPCPPVPEQVVAALTLILDDLADDTDA